MPALLLLAHPCCTGCFLDPHLAARRVMDNNPALDLQHLLPVLLSMLPRHPYPLRRGAHLRGQLLCCRRIQYWGGGSSDDNDGTCIVGSVVLQHKTQCQCCYKRIATNT